MYTMAFFSAGLGMLKFARKRKKTVLWIIIFATALSMISPFKGMCIMYMYIMCITK